MSNAGSSSFVEHGHSTPGSVPIAMAPLTILGCNASALARTSSRRISPLHPIDRQDFSTPVPFHNAKAHELVEQAVDRTVGKTLSQENARSRGFSQISLESITDSPLQPGHHPPPTLRYSSTSASASSMSSTLSSSAATPNSTNATLTSMDDVRYHRSLPPISMIGLEPLTHNMLSDSVGSPNIISSTHLPSLYALPLPRNSSSLSSSSGE